MTNSIDSNSYHTQKIILLKQYLDLSERLLGIHVEDDWHEIDEFFLKRDAIILLLRKQDEFFSKEARNDCSQDQKTQIDKLVNLILAIDKDIARLISQEQDKIVESMKSNTQEQKIAGYTAMNVIQCNRHIDIRK